MLHAFIVYQSMKSYNDTTKKMHIYASNNIILAGKDANQERNGMKYL